MHSQKNQRVIQVKRNQTNVGGTENPLQQPSKSLNLTMRSTVGLNLTHAHSLVGSVLDSTTGGVPRGSQRRHTVDVSYGTDFIQNSLTEDEFVRRLGRGAMRNLFADLGLLGSIRSFDAVYDRALEYYKGAEEHDEEEHDPEI